MSRPGLKRVLELAASRSLTLNLLASLILYVGIVLVFSMRAPAPVVTAIAEGIPNRVAYVLIAINLVACLTLFIRPLVVRCGPWQLAAGADETRAPDAVLPAAAADRIPALARALRWRAWSVRHTPGALHSTQGRFSALGTPLFHVALLTIAAGALVEHLGGFSGVAIVDEGQSFYGEKREYRSSDAGRLPEVSFQVQAIAPRFLGENLFFFTDLVARIVGPIGPESKEQEARLAEPASINGVRVALVGFGYSLAVRTRDAEGTAEEVELPLHIFPAGNPDAFRLPGASYELSVALYPDYAADPSGAPLSRSMAPRNPRLFVSARRGRVVEVERLLRLGETLELGGAALTPLQLIPQGQFRVQYSPGAPVIAIGLVAAIAGLCFRVLRPRRELLICPRAGELAVYLEGEGAGAELRRALIERLGGERPAERTA